MKSSFGNFIREARKEKGLSQEDVASGLGFVRSYIARLENNEFKSPSAKVLIQLAKTLGVPHDALFRAAGYLEANGSQSGFMLGHRDAKDMTTDENKQADKETQDFIKAAREQAKKTQE